MFGKKWVSLLAVVSTGSVVASDLSLEPCINADVSASGRYATQAIEDQANAYLDWQLNAPHYALWGRSMAPRTHQPGADNELPGQRSVILPDIR